MSRFVRRTALVLTVAVVGSLGSPARAVEVMVGATSDNTIFEDAAGGLSNGSGPHIYAGVNSDGLIRRAMVRFDLAGVPAGATINRVTVQLSKTNAPRAADERVSLHRLLVNWGEGGSSAGEPGGMGAVAMMDDATWTHRFFGTTDTWMTPGGSADVDYAGTESARATVTSGGGPPEPVIWMSTPALVADVQAWVDDPSSNFGWMLIGNESSTQTARRFGSRENAAVAPVLTIDFTPGGGGTGAGTVPDGNDVPGTPLFAVKVLPDQVMLTWDASCLASDTDYEVYEGSLDDFTSHVPIAPDGCTTGGLTSQTFTPAAGGTYYWVVPSNGTSEGSYGVDALGAERPPSTAACLPQDIDPC